MPRTLRDKPETLAAHYAREFDLLATQHAQKAATARNRGNIAAALIQEYWSAGCKEAADLYRQDSYWQEGNSHESA